MQRSLESLLRTRFPPVAFACGYGSGVFKQASKVGGSQSQKMVDTIFAVTNAKEWHRENIQRNGRDYSFLPRHVMSTGLIESVQRRYGGKIWFNTLIPCETESGPIVMKYGVITFDDFIDDLEDWRTYYVSGRLQKPVLVLQPTVENANHVSSVAAQAMRKNHESALRAALILLSSQPSFTANVLLEVIVGLSYTGDVRVGLAESPTKVGDITKGSFSELRKIYIESDLGKRLLSAVGSDRYVSNEDFPRLVQGLPLQFRQIRDAETLALQLKTLIRGFSASQTLKGVLTAGLLKSAQYSTAKIMKRWSQ